MLSARQRGFVAEYLMDKNATQAAIRAGYSVATAKQQGSRLLAHPEVKAAVAAALEQLAADAGVKAEHIVARLKRIAWAEPGETWRGSDILKASELLGRYLGMWEEKEERRGVTLEEMVVAADRVFKAQRAAIAAGSPRAAGGQTVEASSQPAQPPSHTAPQRPPTPPAPIAPVVRPAVLPSLAFPAPPMLQSPDEQRPTRCVTDFDPFNRN